MQGCAPLIRRPGDAVMANNRNKRKGGTKGAPQADLFDDPVLQIAADAGSIFERATLEYVEHFLQMLAPNASAYAYALQIFGHLAKKTRSNREVYPGLLPGVFSDLHGLISAISDNPMLHEAGSEASSLDSNDTQPDTEGRAHQGSRREHVLSGLFWDSGHSAYQSVSDAFAGFVILADAASTPSPETENNLLIAGSSFRRVLGTGRATAKLGGNFLQRVDRLLRSSVGLLDVHNGLIELQHQFPEEDVQLPRLFMRLTKQSKVDTRALDEQLYSKGSILSSQADNRKRNDLQEVDLYVVFGSAGSSETAADLVGTYLNLELQSKTWGWAAGLEAIRPGSGEYLSADCRYRLGEYLQDEVDNDCCSVGGLILLLVMYLNKDPGRVYDTHCGL